MKETAIICSIKQNEISPFFIDLSNARIRGINVEPKFRGIIVNYPFISPRKTFVL